jgi:hypothetical protein
MLGVVAEQFGMSKNRLAEQMLERELQAAALSLEQDLAGTMDLLRRYNRTTDAERHILAFGEGEAFGDDPLRSRSTAANDEVGVDPFGITDVFSQ